MTQYDIKIKYNAEFYTFNQIKYEFLHQSN